ncbi:hypothetical protein RNAN_1915 [Rheinheimera nanhaiensis E407-8]|uniref:Uncharacterized protein n=1 Tax=Rheinheimera nanhaiensis E407-8 TaxID=562729 RepID=I1DXZ9_9GAMM|nr:hypothetical protein RNAN_1915 [Rheinheimera nanhaiensis E407-8]
MLSSVMQADAEEQQLLPALSLAVQFIYPLIVILFCHDTLR